MARLFDELERTDASYAAHLESSFEFYNRIATPGWSAVREQLEDWYSLYARDAGPEKAADLRARFRSRDARQHLAAWWELYVYRLLKALFPSGRIEMEPTIEGASGRPDFVVYDSRTGVPILFVEAVTTFTGIVEDDGRNRGLVAYVLDAINEIRSRDFWIGIDFARVGDEQPRKREIQEPIEQWLATLDRDEEIRRIEGGGRRRDRIVFRGWEVEVQPLPKGTPGISPTERLIGMGPGGGGFINDAAYLKAAVVAKAGRYGALPAPYVIAVTTTSPLLHNEDVVRALVGTRRQRFEPSDPDGGEIEVVRDGAWSDKAAGVAAVLTGAGILPWTTPETPPVLWVNPAVAAALPAELSSLLWVAFSADGDPEEATGGIDLRESFGLSPDWPGEFWPDR